MIGLRRYSIKRIKELRELIHKYNYEYYVNSTSLITDFEYDKLFQELKKLENKNPNLKIKSSPTELVGIKSLESKFQHSQKMLSLNNAFSFEELKKFDKKFQKYKSFENDFYICEKKFDGIAVSIKFENEKIVCLTRGDGEYGQNITEKMLHYIPEINKKLKNLEIRGEVIIKKEEFQKISNIYSNPRNLISGLLLGKEKKDIKLNFVGYQIINNEFKNQEESLLKLKKYGFEIDDQYVKSSDIKEIYNFISKINKNDFNYEIDGMVIKINNFQVQNLVGISNRYPKWAIAYKFPSVELKSKLIDIKYQVTRYGKIVPVGIINPIEIGGVMIKKGSLFNFDYIINNKIEIGDEIKISRAGDVVPRIESFLLKNETKYQFPKVCPCSFESILEKRENQLFCKNLDCQEILILKLDHFVKSLEMKGISKSTLSDLVKNGFLKEYIDLFNLSKYKNDIKKLKGYGEKKIQNIFSELEKSKKEINFFKLLIGIGTPKEKSKKIIEKFSNFSEYDPNYIKLDILIQSKNKINF